VLIINPITDLDNLINEPRETLDVEAKEWLDRTDNDHRSMVAKEIITLARSRGGFLVIGLKREQMGLSSPQLVARPT
jgi:hypothetical protein